MSWFGTVVRNAVFLITITAVWSYLFLFDPILGFLFFVPLAAVPIVVWSIVMLRRIVITAYRRAWRKCAQTLFVFVAVWPLTAVTIVLVILSRDYVHLAVMYPFYVSKIEAATREAGSVEFHWNGTTNSDRWLIYDSGGKQAEEVGVKPLENEPDVQISISHLIGKFYIKEASW